MTKIAFASIGLLSAVGLIVLQIRAMQHPVDDDPGHRRSIIRMQVYRANLDASVTPTESR